MPDQPAAACLEDQVADADWYHCIDLPGGITTPGEYDLPGVLRCLPFPGSLAGRRCLDVGIRDGFWGFTMERRGAAEVLGIDIENTDDLDWPQPRPELSPAVLERLDARARTFEIAAAALRSKVERRFLSVYELDPAVVGTFDFAFIGTLLLHLRDPLGALNAIRRVVTGELFVNEPVSLPLTALRPRTPSAQLMEFDAPFWWLANVAGLQREIKAAGWDVVDRARRPYLVRYGPTGAPPPLLPVTRLSDLTLRLTLRKGMPHVWFRCRPR